MIIVEGIIYLIDTDEMKLEFNPFNFLLDINKIVYSEVFETVLAIKLRDLGKFENRDHAVLEVKDKRLFFDFLLEYADQEHDEVIFEQNEEFNMIINLSPVWFSFEDVEKSKKEQALLLKNNQFDLKGFLEIKENSAVNIFKSLFQGKKAQWENKYCVLKGVKLYIYQGKSSGDNKNQFTKP